MSREMVTFRDPLNDERVSINKDVSAAFETDTIFAKLDVNPDPITRGFGVGAEICKGLTIGVARLLIRNNAEEDIYNPFGPDSVPFTYKS
jgi:hypothetical protein